MMSQRAREILRLQEQFYAPQTDPALIAILERMQQDQARQAQESASNFAQF